MTIKQLFTKPFFFLTILLLTRPCFSENRALLIGINDYKYVTPKLMGSVIDVINIEKLAIKRMGYTANQVTVLTDSQATKENIINTIKSELINKTNKEDRVLFYYSGHGFQTKDLNGDESDSLDEALAPVDTTSNLKNLITDDELRHLFDRIKNRKVTVIIDSCHSGTITRGIIKNNKGIIAKTIQSFKPLARGVNDVTESHIFQQHRKEEAFLKSQSNRIVWTAVTAGQVAYVDVTFPPQGVFTHSLYTGIESKAADIDNNGIISNSELLKYTRKKSTEFCSKHSSTCKLGLTPTLEIPKELANTSFLPHSGFTNPPSLANFIDNALPETDKSSILIDIEANGRQTKTVNLKEEISIYIQSKAEGYLLLLDRNAAGELKQLFPNASAKDNHIQANQDIFIPIDNSQYSVTATELGKSELIAVVTHDKINLGDINLPLNKDIIPVPKPKDYINNLAILLQTPWTEDKVNRQAEYSIAKFIYTVK